MGMRAATGAISAVGIADASLRVSVLGGGEPKGICGSGLVDAVACGLDLQRILPSGRLGSGTPFEVAGTVTLSPWDIRELQLAKGAIAAGIRLLVRRWGTRPEELGGIWLAGAFGNYISRASARRIGLLEFPVERVEPAGNTALRGAKLSLCGAVPEAPDFAELRARTTHLSLKDDPEFEDAYVAAMGFPPGP
jgi:uncharacterized 2Fe-2S/4Fe-4S cluster protein (DUF4445 family)